MAREFAWARWVEWIVVSITPVVIGRMYPPKNKMSHMTPTRGLVLSMLGRMMPKKVHMEPAIMQDIKVYLALNPPSLLPMYPPVIAPKMGAVMEVTAKYQWVSYFETPITSMK